MLRAAGLSSRFAAAANLDTSDEESEDEAPIFGASAAEAQIVSSDDEDDDEIIDLPPISPANSSGDESDDSSVEEPEPVPRRRGRVSPLILPQILTARGGRTWSTQPPPHAQTRAHNVLKAPRKVFLPPQGIQTPGEMFKQFITPAMANTIVQETNRHASNNHSDWDKDVTVEVCTYIGYVRT